MPFPWSELDSPPDTDVPELSVFGPGYGECIVAHIGGGNWIVVDSCADEETGDPVALRYLQAIGVSPLAVRFIVATHWHDDHIRGLSKVVQACINAKFICAKVLTQREFADFVATLGANNMASSGTGVSEFKGIHATLAASKRPRVWAGVDRRILIEPNNASSPHFELWSLSPSDEEFGRFVEFMAREAAQRGEAKRRAPTRKPNDTSVVLLLDWGSKTAILGSDLETFASNLRGWGAIVSSTGRPQKRANYLKVPHHGGESAHHEAMWTDLLSESPVAVLTPFARGRGLPTDKDVARIRSRTPHAYATALRASIPVKLDSPVTKTLGEANIRITKPPKLGMVQARYIGAAWQIRLFQQAHSLG